MHKSLPPPPIRDSPTSRSWLGPDGWYARLQARVSDAGQILWDQLDFTGSNLADLETEMTTWDAMEGGKSPNRIDSLVWGLTELMLNNREQHISL